jgi:uncharacterized membrane protein YoaK (UPF0700 family)
MKTSVPDLLTFNGGYVDTAGYLALQGLFTAHVTGNFVTLGASLVHGTPGALPKILALPVFCAVVLGIRLFNSYVSRGGAVALNGLLGAKIVLFIAAAVLAISLGPFNNGDSAGALVTGMTLVAAMAIQNAVHRIFFTKSPPTTLMTGSTTQIMMDIGDLMTDRLPPEARSAARARCITLLRSVCIFAVGCGMAALAYARVGVLVFIVPPGTAALAFIPRLQARTEV